MTDLFERTINFSYDDPERSALMRKVWSVTPHMINCYTGSINSDREREIRQWLYTNIGDQAYPIHGREGDWQLGSAVIYGWTFLGFSRKKLLDKFLQAFPDAIEGDQI